MQIPVGLEQNRMQKGKCKREAAEGQNYAASAGRSQSINSVQFMQENRT